MTYYTFKKNKVAGPKFTEEFISSENTISYINQACDLYYKWLLPKANLIDRGEKFQVNGTDYQYKKDKYISIKNCWEAGNKKKEFLWSKCEVQGYSLNEVKNGIQFVYELQPTYIENAKQGWFLKQPVDTVKKLVNQLVKVIREWVDEDLCMEFDGLIGAPVERGTNIDIQNITVAVANVPGQDKLGTYAKALAADIFSRYDAEAQDDKVAYTEYDLSHMILVCLNFARLFNQPRKTHYVLEHSWWDLPTTEEECRIFRAELQILVSQLWKMTKFTGKVIIYEVIPHALTSPTRVDTTVPLFDKWTIMPMDVCEPTNMTEFLKWTNKRQLELYGEPIQKQPRPTSLFMQSPRKTVMTIDHPSIEPIPIIKLDPVPLKKRKRSLIESVEDVSDKKQIKVDLLSEPRILVYTDNASYIKCAINCCSDQERLQYIKTFEPLDDECRKMFTDGGLKVKPTEDPEDEKASFIAKYANLNQWALKQEKPLFSSSQKYTSKDHTKIWIDRLPSKQVEIMVHRSDGAYNWESHKEIWSAILPLAILLSDPIYNFFSCREDDEKKLVDSIKSACQQIWPKQPIHLCYNLKPTGINYASIIGRCSATMDNALRFASYQKIHVCPVMYHERKYVFKPIMCAWDISRFQEKHGINLSVPLYYEDFQKIQDFFLLTLKTGCMLIADNAEVSYENNDKTNITTVTAMSMNLLTHINNNVSGKVGALCCVASHSAKISQPHTVMPLKMGKLVEEKLKFTF